MCSCGELVILSGWRTAFSGPTRLYRLIISRRQMWIVLFSVTKELQVIYYCSRATELRRISGGKRGQVVLTLSPDFNSLKNKHWRLTLPVMQPDCNFWLNPFPPGNSCSSFRRLFPGGSFWVQSYSGYNTAHWQTDFNWWRRRKLRCFFFRWNNVLNVFPEDTGEQTDQRMSTPAFFTRLYHFHLTCHKLDVLHYFKILCYFFMVVKWIIIRGGELTTSSFRENAFSHRTHLFPLIILGCESVLPSSKHHYAAYYLQLSTSSVSNLKIKI